MPGGAPGVHHAPALFEPVLVFDELEWTEHEFGAVGLVFPALERHDARTHACQLRETEHAAKPGDVDPVFGREHGEHQKTRRCEHRHERIF